MTHLFVWSYAFFKIFSLSLQLCQVADHVNKENYRPFFCNKSKGMLCQRQRRKKFNFKPVSIQLRWPSPYVGSALLLSLWKLDMLSLGLLSLQSAESITMWKLNFIPYPKEYGLLTKWLITMTVRQFATSYTSQQQWPFQLFCELLKKRYLHSKSLFNYLSNQGRSSTLISSTSMDIHWWFELHRHQFIEPKTVCKWKSSGPT